MRQLRKKAASAVAKHNLDQGVISLHLYVSRQSIFIAVVQNDTNVLLSVIPEESIYEESMLPAKKCKSSNILRIMCGTGYRSNPSKNMVMAIASAFT